MSELGSLSGCMLENDVEARSRARKLRQKALVASIVFEAALLGAMLLISGISGSKTADMAAVAPVLFPEMRKRGMKDGELVSLLAASCCLKGTIPTPSSFKVERLKGSHLCWRPRSHEVPGVSSYLCKRPWFCCWC